MTQKDKVNAQLGGDGSYLPYVPTGATAAEVREICRKLDVTVGEAERRRMMGEITYRAFFSANPGLEPGFLTRKK
jgi:hypothetical protein